MDPANRGVSTMSADALMKVDNVDGFEGYEDRNRVGVRVAAAE
jgi:hypothetical protein